MTVENFGALQRWAVPARGSGNGEGDIRRPQPDHPQQARALAELEARQTYGFPPEKLTLVLAGLFDLEPWLGQCHVPRTDYLEVFDPQDDFPQRIGA